MSNGKTITPSAKPQKMVQVDLEKTSRDESQIRIVRTKK